tara:strand:+ start:2636 stop:3193 length:558 start_codon:yes stop_codon:yes gene_type:complete
MAIAKKISKLFVKAKDYSVSTDFCYIITPTSFNVSLGLVSFGGINDEAIDGSKRSNIRGYRINLDLPHEMLVESTFKRTTFGTTGDPDSFPTPFDFNQVLSDFSNSNVSTFINDIITVFKTNSDNFIEVSFDGLYESSVKDFRKVVVDSSSFKTTFTNQIGRDSSNIKFVGQKILTEIPTELQAT